MAYIAMASGSPCMCGAFFRQYALTINKQLRVVAICVGKEAEQTDLQLYMYSVTCLFKQLNAFNASIKIIASVSSLAKNLHHHVDSHFTTSILART